MANSPECSIKLYDDGTAEITVKGQTWALHPEDVAAWQAELMLSQPGQLITFEVKGKGCVMVRRTGYPQMIKFTAEEKLKEVYREIAYRTSVYARRVMNGAMTQEQADRQLAIMSAIADDYSQLAQKERLL